MAAAAAAAVVDLDDVYGAIIKERIYPVHLMNAVQCQVAANPVTKQTYLDNESNCRPHPTAVATLRNYWPIQQRKNHNFAELLKYLPVVARSSCRNKLFIKHM